jgi:hypothetical protein
VDEPLTPNIELRWISARDSGKELAAKRRKKRREVVGKLGDQEIGRLRNLVIGKFVNPLISKSSNFQMLLRLLLCEVGILRYVARVFAARLC